MKEIWVQNKELAKSLNVFHFTNLPIFEVGSFADLTKLANVSDERIFVRATNWRVIPAENLIAMKGNHKIIMVVESASDAKLLFETLEKGVDGVLFEKATPRDIEEVQRFLSSPKPLPLTSATLIEVRKISGGNRSCIDTAELLSADEGILSGNSAQGFFLVQAEVTENPHVNTRPFRVNAGAVSLYTLLADHTTRYLSEIQAGDDILIVRRDGSTRKAPVVRNKIEWRPLILLVAKTDDGLIVKTVLQDAETIRVLTPTGSASVSELSVGSPVLVHQSEAKARHFGRVVDEHIIEK